MKCPKCGAEYETGRQECIQCGIIFAKYEAMQKQKHHELMTQCKICGKYISKNAESCPGCGEPNKTSSATKIAIEPKQLHKNMIKCGECGATFHKTSKKCPKCGRTNKKSAHLPGSQVAICFLVVFGLIWFMASGDSSSSRKTDQPPKKENPNCHLDLQCWGDKHFIAASVRCPAHVEKLAKYSHKWTDGTLDPKFSSFAWADQEEGTLTYIGDKIQFQNGFGAMQNHTYECDYDPNTESVLDVRAYPK